MEDKKSPLAQQFARLHAALDRFVYDSSDREWLTESRAALSVIEQWATDVALHVQDMETALERIAKGYHLEDHDYTGACGGRCAQKMARAALSASGTRNPRNRVAREKGTQDE